MAIISSGATYDQLTITATPSNTTKHTHYDSSSREVAIQGKSTFAASGNFTPAATPTDLLVISGSQTKTVRVMSIKFATTNTATASQQFFLVKRSNPNIGGTSVLTSATGGRNELDSNTTGPSGTVFHYTANPTLLGSLVGTISTIRIVSPPTVPQGPTTGNIEFGIEFLHWMANTSLDQPIALRGTNQQLSVNFNGAALVTGQTHAYTVVWVEE